jgi:hypothetical protein
LRSILFWAILRFVCLCHCPTRMVQSSDVGHVKAVVLDNREKHFPVRAWCRLRVVHPGHESRNRDALAASQPHPFVCWTPGRFRLKFTNFFQVPWFIGISKCWSGKRWR